MSSLPQNALEETPRLSAPPRPRTVFRIGVSGHRPNRLQAAWLPELEAGIERVLRAAMKELEAYAVVGAPAPLLRVLCCLAEGTDRIAARIALRLGCDLQVVLPFLRPDYEKDFVATPGSVEEFRGLLAEASAVVELNTQTRDRVFGYRDAGDTVLLHCDLLLAVWDGQPSAGVGGTVDLVEHAEARGVPTLILDPKAPQRVEVNAAEGMLHGATEGFAALRETLAATVALPEKHFFWSEARPLRNDSASYTMLHLLGDHKWAKAPQPQPESCALDLRTRPLCPYFGWADALAVHYGERSRSAALRLQLLASVAVLCALLRLPVDQHLVWLRVLSALELGCILLLLITALRVGFAHWHERWLFYRSLAEHVRCLDVLAPIAQTLPAPPVLGFLREEAGGSADFANRYLRAVQRESGLLPAVADEAFLKERLTILEDVIARQAEFHEAAAARYERVESLLKRAGLALFAGAVLLCVYEMVHAFGRHWAHGSWLATASAVLPALGAAAASVAAQSELKRLAVRSGAMGRTLRAILPQVQQLQQPTMRSVIAVSRRVAEILTSEVRDWQVLVSAKPPELPT